MRRTLCTLTACALALLLAAPALTQTPVRLPELDAATTPLGDDDLFLVRQDGDTRDEKVTWANVRASLQDALVLALGPASVCADNQLARWDGASNTQLKCSDLSVLDVTSWDWSDGNGEVDTIDLRAISYPLNISTFRTKIRLGATGSLFPIVPARVYLGGDVVVEGGDITAPDALTISTAGSNGDITLDPNGTGNAILASGNLALHGETASQSMIKPVGLWTEFKKADDSGYANVTALGVYANGDLFLYGATSKLWFYGGHYLLTDGASNVTGLRNDTNAQTFRVYGTWSDNASNYERVALSCDGSADCTLAAETAGTGADDVDLHLTAAGAGRVTVNSLLSLTGVAEPPGSPAAGDIAYDNVNNLFCGYNGSAWVSFSGAGTCWAD